ncbi:MAG TPA: pilus assembly protein TadG-related protein, partial [Candidatus Dormibacteraeota bacterium]
MVAALMVPVLLGFTALSVDVSNISTQKRALQSLSDHTALTAGFQMLNGRTRAQATLAAEQVATLDGYQTSELAVTYYDSAHVVATTDASVEYVATTVTHT